MAKHIPPDKIAEIKNRADIVTVISEYIALKKAGNNLLGSCPFHKEKTPSFTVSPDKQFFYCFGCGAGGHVFTFLTKISGMSFPEAVRHLAEKTGVTIDFQGASDQNGKPNTRRQILQINQMALKFFTNTLHSKEGGQATDYLARRGISIKTIERFALGYAPPTWGGLRDFFRRRGVAMELAQLAGLVIDKNGDYYDRFRGRLIFPILGTDGEIVAFGGRALDDTTPKYLNSPETPVYTKGKTLYGFSTNRDQIRTKDSAIIVEGYFDLLSLWNAGIENCVASLGTALTAEQVDLVSRFTKNVIVMFDSDEAGRKAMRRSLELFLSRGVQARLMILPPGHDPDSYIRAQGKDRMASDIDGAYPLVDFFIDEIIGSANSFEDTRGVVREAVSLLATIENPLEKDLFIKRIADRLTIDAKTLKREIEKQARPAPEKVTAPQQKSGKAGEDVLELALLHIMLEHPERIVDLHRDGVFQTLINDEVRKLAEILYDTCHAQGLTKIDTTLIINGLAPSPFRERILRMLMEPLPYTRDILDRALVDITGQIKKRWLRIKQGQLNRDLVRAEARGDRELRHRILEEKSNLLADEKKIGAPPSQ